MYRPFVTCEDPKGVVECGTIRKSSHRHKKKKISAGGGEHHHPNPSSFQLMEVSKGAKKLMNKVLIDEQHGSSKDESMAEDLLKGALHLKDSLVMLGKLQDASDYMSKLKQQKQLRERERRVIDDDDGFPSVMRRATSCREQDPNFQMMGFQRPRLSVDGGGDYIDELRMAIADSFDRQNLLSVEERASLLYRRRRDQEESMTKSSDQTLSKVVEKKKDKSSSTSSNVIARLMGLEDILPPESPPKRMDIGVPNSNVRKLKQKKEDYLFNMKEAEIQQRSLKELLETMEFRGLLKKSTSVKKYTTQQLLPEGVPPVVLIKPFYMPESEFSTSEDEFVRSNDVIMRKVEAKDENFAPGRSYQERTAKNLRSRRIGKEEEQVLTVVVQREGQVKGKNRMPREDAGGKSVTGKNRACKEQKEVVQRVKDSIKSNAKVIVDRKVDKNQKVVNEVPEVKETVKVRSGSARVEDNKTKVPTFREMRDSGSGRIGSRSQRVEQRSGTRNAKPKKKRKNEEQKEKLVDDVKEKITKSADKPEHKEVDLIEPVVEGSIPVTSGSLQTFREEETNSSAFPREEHSTETYSSPTPECGKHLQLKTSKAEDSNLRGRIQFKTFLLSSRGLLVRTEQQLFPLPLQIPNPLSPVSRINDSETSLCTKLSLDYANELIECRPSSTIPDSQARSRYYCMLPPSCASLDDDNIDEVVEQVCNGIAELKNYLKLNSVSAILERDLKSTGVTVSRVWESGWRNGLCTEEAEEAVSKLEKLILDHLIEEVFT